MKIASVASSTCMRLLKFRKKNVTKRQERKNIWRVNRINSKKIKISMPIEADKK